MNSLSDLRSTLDEHAERVPDGEAVVRTAAVRHRVSVVRRRRRTVAAGGLSLALVLVGAASFMSRDHSDALPAAPTVLGVKAPVTMNSLGYSYRTDGTSETIAGRGSVEVDASSQPRLVSWTTDRPTTVRLELPGGDYWTSSASRFRDFVMIPPGPGGSLRVSASEGRVGLAMYDVTDAQPDGVTRDGVTFRRTVADSPLLTAAIGGAGQTVVRTSFLGVPGQVRMSVLCTGAPAGSRFHVGMAGTESTSSCDSTGFDPGGGSVGTAAVGHLGRPVPVRVWVSGPHTSTPLPAGSGGVRLGIGLYGPIASDQVAGAAVEHAVEYGGHTWHLHDVVRSRTSPIRLRGGQQTSIAEVVMRMSSGAPTDLRFHATGMPTQRTGFSGRGSGSTGPYWVPAGADVRVTRSTPGALGLGVYTLAD
jgi:hypothetical protein